MVTDWNCFRGELQSPGMTSHERSSIEQETSVGHPLLPLAGMEGFSEYFVLPTRCGPCAEQEQCSTVSSLPADLLAELLALPDV